MFYSSATSSEEFRFYLGTSSSVLEDKESMVINNKQFNYVVSFPLIEPQPPPEEYQSVPLNQLFTMYAKVGDNYYTVFATSSLDEPDNYYLFYDVVLPTFISNKFYWDGTYLYYNDNKIGLDTNGIYGQLLYPSSTSSSIVFSLNNEMIIDSIDTVFSSRAFPVGDENVYSFWVNNSNSENIPVTFYATVSEAPPPPVYTCSNTDIASNDISYLNVFMYQPNILQKEVFECNSSNPISFPIVDNYIKLLPSVSSENENKYEFVLHNTLDINESSNMFIDNENNLRIVNNDTGDILYVFPNSKTPTRNTLLVASLTAPNYDITKFYWDNVSLTLKNLCFNTYVQYGNGTPQNYDFYNYFLGLNKISYPAVVVFSNRLILQ